MGEPADERNSIVEYLYEPGGPRPYKCGYCKCPDTSYATGVWGYKMACQDYQNLVDRGFQRSGKFVYTPGMKKTCCPQYVIRMDVKRFNLSKSQKSSIRTFKHYLLEGRKPKPTKSSMEGAASSSCAASESTQPTSKVKSAVKPGVGPDPNKPLCKKAKVIRKERREKKLSELGTVKQPETTLSCNSHSLNEYQHLEEILTFPKDEDCIHKYRSRLVKVNSKEFTDSYQESFQVFKKFQTVIHKESEADAGEKQFNEFLVYTPLMYEDGSEKMTIEFGTYHQQYFLDDKIFAVGVLDILPKGTLCEYLYYDPEYRFLAPGVITALLEISLAQQFYLQNPDMQYYYMGFYVQSCPKMNYKSRYSASDLLCPETYTYVPLAKCIPKLKAAAYSRLAEEEEVMSPCNSYTADQLKCVPVLADHTFMSYETYLTLHGNDADALLKEYTELVGLEIALNMRVYLGRR